MTDYHCPFLQKECGTTELQPLEMMKTETMAYTESWKPHI